MSMLIVDPPSFKFHNRTDIKYLHAYLIDYNQANSTK